jgi:predicted nucleic acid-binding protein
MLLIYLVEGHPEFSKRVEELLEISFRRKDRLFTSYLGLGELMAGAAKVAGPAALSRIRAVLVEMGISFLPFDGASVDVFAFLRAEHRLKAPDAIHLACAAGAGIDLFLTGDKQLMKLEIPGIHFIADFDTPLLQL